MIAQDTRKIGELAMEKLRAQMSGRSIEGHTMVAPMLLTSESVASERVRALLEFPGYDWSRQ